MPNRDGERITRVEVMLENLAKTTERNTNAIEELTEAISVNKGILIASVKFAGALTVVAGGAWALGTWVASLFHIGSR